MDGGAPGDKRPYHHGDLRRTLLDLAARHIAEHGPEGLSLRALAADAGVAHRAAYRHFPDKDGLLATVYAEAYSRLADRLDAAQCIGSPPKRLRMVARVYAQWAFDEPLMFLALSGPRVNAAGRHDALEAAIARCWRHVVRPIGEGCVSGAFRTTPTLGAALFWGGLQGVLAQAVLGRLKLGAAERAAFFDDIGARLVASLTATLDGE